MKRYLSLNRRADPATIGKWMIPVATARLNEKRQEEESAIVRFLEIALSRR
jgi:hypothetical protein